MELTMAGYGNLLNLIIRPAGRSRSFKWLGRGDISNIPYNVPRPIFIPRWIPKGRPEYVAKWVPTTPGPQSSKGSPHQSGFGTPKSNSVVQAQNLPPTHDVAPVAPAPISAPAPAPIAAPAPAPIYAPTPVQNNAVEPSSYAPPPPAAESSGYAAPHADDIISPTVESTGTIIQDPVIHQQNVIPETAIRNELPLVQEVSGEPSFSPLVQDQLIIGEPSFSPFIQDQSAVGEPNNSPLIQDQAVVDLNGFQPVDPNSIIILNEGNINDQGNTDDIVPDFIVTEGPRSVANLVEPNIVFSPAAPDTFLISDVASPTPTDFSIQESTTIDEEKDPLFIVDTESPNNPLTTTLLLEDETLQNLQDNAGKSFVVPTVLSQTLEPIQSSLVNQPKLETLFNEDVNTKISQIDVATKLNQDITADDSLLFIHDSQNNDGLQISQNLQPSQEFNPDNSQIFIQGTGQNGDSGFVSQPNQESQLQQNIQLDNNNKIFLVTNKDTGASEELNLDQQAQFSNFQLGQRIQFRPLPIQEHDTNTRPVIPSLPRPALMAPPVSPVLATGRSFFQSRHDTVNHAVPSARSISTGRAIPQPVPIPIGPLATLTLDFPSEGAGVRQARVASDILPFGARLNSRIARRYQSQPLYYGK